MPKETVHYGQKYLIVDHPESEEHSAFWSEHKYEGRQSDSNGEVLPFPPDTTYAESPSVEVLWSRPGNADELPVGVDPTGFAMIGFKIHKAEFSHHEKGIMSENENFFHIYTRSLTRHQINDMIKTLRRARDAAYGTDE